MPWLIGKSETASSQSQNPIIFLDVPSKTNTDAAALTQIFFMRIMSSPLQDLSPVGGITQHTYPSSEPLSLAAGGPGWDSSH